MAEIPDIDVSSGSVERAMRWSEVLERPRGKARFQAGRDILREWLKERGVPSVAKNFLNARMISSASRGVKPKIPAALGKILGIQGVNDFAEELQTAHYFLTGKVPANAKNAFTNMLGALEGAGMPPEHIAALKKIGPAKLIQMGGPGRAVTALAEAQRDPAFISLFKWAGRKVTGKTAAARIPIPLEQAAAKFKPSAATIEGLKGAGVKGLGAGARALKGVGTLGALGLAADVYFGASELKERGAENQRAAEMAATGVIPQELGGEPVVGATEKGEPITASQFLNMMRERENNAKLARFNAATQEADLTRQVLGYISGSSGPETAPPSRRIQLGSARPPAAAKSAPTDQVIEQFDQFLRQSTAGL